MSCLVSDAITDLRESYMQKAPGVASFGMLSWRKWLTRTYHVYTQNMEATSKHQDAKECWEESCYCGVLDIQSVVTDKVYYIIFLFVFLICQSG